MNSLIELIPGVLMWLVFFALVTGVILGAVGLPGAAACGFIIRELFWPAVISGLTKCFVGLFIPMIGKD